MSIRVDAPMLGGIPQWRGVDWCEDFLPLFHRWSEGYIQSAWNFWKYGRPLSQITQIRTLFTLQSKSPGKSCWLGYSWVVWRSYDPVECKIAPVWFIWWQRLFRLHMGTWLHPDFVSPQSMGNPCLLKSTHHPSPSPFIDAHVHCMHLGLFWKEGLPNNGSYKRMGHHLQSMKWLNPSSLGGMVVSPLPC